MVFYPSKQLLINGICNHLKTAVLDHSYRFFFIQDGFLAAAKYRPVHELHLYPKVVRNTFFVLFLL